MTAIPLTETLHNLAAQAIRSPASRVKADIGGGLFVHVRVSDGRLHIGVSRKLPDAPTGRDWNRVVNAFPQPLPRVEPRQQEQDGRCYLRASWAVTELAQEQQP